MAGIDYRSMLTIVQGMLAPFPNGNGVAMTCSRIGAATYDPVSGTTAGGTQQTMTFCGISVPVDSSYIDGNTNGWRKEFRNGTDIIEIDSKVVLAPNANNDVPIMGDRFTTPDGTFTAKTVEPLSPAGIVLLWEIGLVR